MNIRWFAAALSMVLAVSLSPSISEAKRVGGGKNTGMQRQAPARTAPQTPPPQTPMAPAQGAATAGAPATAAATAAAAAPAKRSWMGPLAGLAAGLGLAALFSHLGMGEGFANFVMMLLLAVVAFVAIRFVMGRMRAGRQPALAGAAAGAGTSGGSAQTAPWATQPAEGRSIARSNLDSAAPSAPTSPAAASEVSVTGAPLRPIQIGEALSPSVAAAADVAPTSVAATPSLNTPEGFDLPAFERVAKMIFIRLQAAHDKGDLDDLREFTTPEMFASLRLDIQERNGAEQQTDVERVEAELIDFTQESTRQVASVRFKGLVREEKDSATVAFDEVWHLVKPQDGGRNWAIAGIQQPQ
jgi:predicted lipid-binding transport protein (Tim44 family)